MGVSVISDNQDNHFVEPCWCTVMANAHGGEDVEPLQKLNLLGEGGEHEGQVGTAYRGPHTFKK